MCVVWYVQCVVRCLLLVACVLFDGFSACCAACYMFVVRCLRSVSLVCVGVVCCMLCVVCCLFVVCLCSVVSYSLLECCCWLDVAAWLLFDVCVVGSRFLIDVCCLLLFFCVGSYMLCVVCWSMFAYR